MGGAALPEAKKTQCLAQRFRENKGEKEPPEITNNISAAQKKCCQHGQVENDVSHDIQSTQRRCGNSKTPRQNAIKEISQERADANEQQEPTWTTRPGQDQQRRCQQEASDCQGYGQVQVEHQ